MMQRGTAEALRARPVVYIVDADRGFAEHARDILLAVGIDAVVLTDGPALLATYERERSGCILVSLRIPGMNAMELLREASRLLPHVPVVMIGGEPDVATAVEAVKAGAFDFLVKPVAEQRLLDTVWKAVLREQRTRPIVFEVAEIRARLSRLTERERQVLDLVACGTLNKVIAVKLGISQKTVEAHRCKLMAKMASDTMAGLVRMHVLAQSFGDGLLGLRELPAHATLNHA